MASVATKRRAGNKSYKIKYKALKELKKGAPHKDVSSLFGVPKNTLCNKLLEFSKISASILSS